MSNSPYAYRTVRWRWLFVMTFANWIVCAVFALYARNTIGVVAPVIFAANFGWLFGVMSERNKWREWYDSKEAAQPRKDGDENSTR